MKVRVRLFAVARQLAGAETIDLELPERATVGQLRRELMARLPQLAPLVAHMALAVDSSYAGDDLEISPGAEVACIPPVSGG